MQEISMNYPILLHYEIWYKNIKNTHTHTHTSNVIVFLTVSFTKIVKHEKIEIDTS